MLLYSPIQSNWCVHYWTLLFVKDEEYPTLLLPYGYAYQLEHYYTAEATIACVNAWYLAGTFMCDTICMSLQ